VDVSVATTTVVSAGQSESCGPRAGGVGEVENVGEVVGDDEGDDDNEKKLPPLPLVRSVLRR